MHRGRQLLGQRLLRQEVRRRGVAAVGSVGAGRRMSMKAVVAVVVVGVASMNLGRVHQNAPRGVGGLGARCVTLSTG